MLSRALPAIFAACFVAACSSGGSGAGAAPAPATALAFGVPSVPAAAYQVVDSMTTSMDTPMGPMELQQTSAATLEATFAEAPGGVRVTAVVAEFEASSSNPMGAPFTADSDDLEGDLVFVLDANGEAQLESAPSASGPAAQAAVVEGWAHSLFPRLPDRPVEAGDSWQDTVSWSAEGESDVTSTGAYSYVASGDTVVDGRRLLAIAVSGEVESETKATQGGMQVTMRFDTSETGVALWDPARGIFQGFELNRTMTGTVVLDGMPGAPSIQVTGAGPRSVRLLDGEAR